MANPVTAALIAGTLMQGAGSLFGALGADRAAKRREAEARRRQGKLEAGLTPLLTGGKEVGDAERWLLNLLQGEPGEAWNTGQDALMQMIRGGTYDPSELFTSWEPLEQRALDQALGDTWASAPGLGSRFGSAMRREEGRVRGEAAEGAAARRQQAQVGLYESGENRRMSASQALLNAVLQSQGQKIGAATSAAGLNQQRQQFLASLIGMMYGQPLETRGASAVPGAMGDIGQLLAFLPLFMQMMKPPETTTKPTG